MIQMQDFYSYLLLYSGCSKALVDYWLEEYMFWAVFDDVFVFPARDYCEMNDLNDYFDAAVDFACSNQLYAMK